MLNLSYYTKGNQISRRNGDRVPPKRNSPKSPPTPLCCLPLNAFYANFPYFKVKYQSNCMFYFEAFYFRFLSYNPVYVTSLTFNLIIIRNIFLVWFEINLIVYEYYSFIKLIFISVLGFRIFLVKEILFLWNLYLYEF